MMDIYNALNIGELRARFIEHTRRAYRLLPLLRQPEILDIGCGKGQATVELARLSGGTVTGIDIDRDVVLDLQQRLDQSSIGNRVKAVPVSFFNNNFKSSSFDLLWEEGVLHLLNTSRSLFECYRLVRPGGFLMMHETIVWFKNVREKLEEAGFTYINQYLLPRHFWWTHYGAPLEGRIQIFHQLYGKDQYADELAVYEDAVTQIKSDPDGTDCAFYLLQKAGA